METINPTHLLCDLDGVIIVKDLYFSKRFSEEYGVPTDSVQRFFANEFQECLRGKLDLKVALSPYITEWGVPMSIDEIITYWFSHERKISNNILTQVHALRSTGTKVHISTNNETYRADYIWNTLQLRESFDTVFASGHIGFVKPEQEFWSYIWKKLGEPEKKSVLVWDDNNDNIASARAFGFSAQLIESV
ncbi:MAG: HAD family hydrolase [Minisyncoccia bacterium]